MLCRSLADSILVNAKHTLTEAFQSALCWTFWLKFAQAMPPCNVLDFALTSVRAAIPRSWSAVWSSTLPAMSRKGILQPSRFQLLSGHNSTSAVKVCNALPCNGTDALVDLALTGVLVKEFAKNRPGFSHQTLVPRPKLLFHSFLETRILHPVQLPSHAFN